MRSACASHKLTDDDYTFINIEIPLDDDGIHDNKTETGFGKLLYELKLEDGTELDDDDDYDTYDDDKTPTTASSRRNLFWSKKKKPEHRDLEDKTDSDSDASTATTDSNTNEKKNSRDDEDRAALLKLGKAPYSLMIRNREGYRIYGNKMPEELCLQASLFKHKHENAKEKSKDKHKSDYYDYSD